MPVGFWWKSLEERDHYEDLDRWEDNTKMDLREILWNGMDCIHVAQNKDQ
jgi:hypothetical protein